MIAGCANSCRNEKPEVKEEVLQKEIYVPKEFASIDLNDSTSRYCYAHSVQSENIIVFWEQGFGDDPSQAESYKGHNMKVDVYRLLEQSESFYRMYRDELHFTQKGSGADKYKMMIMLNYSDEGTAYGGDYDGVIGALWITPLRTQDVRLNAIAHELGHSFQMQLRIDSESGFGDGGIYEMTSQWMLWQVNPNWIDDETYHWDAFMTLTHLAFMHPENMYHSPYVLEYWSSKHGVEFIADLWRAAARRRDVVEVYKDFTKLSQEAFNAEMFDAAQRFITYDLPRVKEVAAKYANRHSCEFAAADAEGWYTIAESRTPQQYGYNGIALSVPEAGATVEVAFRGETTEADAGWRYGFVGVRSNGEAIYGDMYSDAEGKASFTTPEGEKLAHLWFVVTAAPSAHHSFTEETAGTCASYPYSIRPEGAALRCTVK